MHRRVALLLDLDGVLWDTESVHARAFEEVCIEHELEPVPYRMLAGRPTNKAFEVILAANGVAITFDAIVHLSMTKQSRARAALKDDPPLSPDLPVIAEVIEKGALVAIVTGASAQTADLFVKASKIEFHAIITAEATAVGKPAPDPYMAGAAALGVAPQRCWALDDSAQGVSSATSAGARTVHLRSSDPCELTHPDVVGCVPDLHQFIAMIEERAQ